MNAHRTRKIAPILTLVAACGATRQPAPSVYPALAAERARNGALDVAFTPNAGVIAVELPCASSELPENGIDDDCDGHVDGRSDSEPYLAISHGPGVAVEVVLRSVSGGAPVATFVSGANEACAASASAPAHVDAFALDAGDYELIANVSAGCDTRADAALSVSLGQGHTRQVFASGNLSATPRVLGRVTVTQADGHGP